MKAQEPIEKGKGGGGKQDVGGGKSDKEPANE